jgi:hypothetical protein
MSAIQVEAARSLMPNMPSSVFDSWLAKLIQGGMEWPFRKPEEPVYETDWYRILFPFNLKSLSLLSWNRRRVILTNEEIFSGSMDDIELLRRNLTTNEIRMLGKDPAPFRQQVLWNCGYIRENHCLHAAPILATTEHGLKIFDGNHRIAALFELQLESKIEIEAWIGE